MLFFVHSYLDKSGCYLLDQVYAILWEIPFFPMVYKMTAGGGEKNIMTFLWIWCLKAKA